MNTIVFHRDIVPLTKVKTVKVSLDSITDLHLYLSNLYPDFTEYFKKHKNTGYSILINGELILPQSWIHQNKILDKNCTLNIVPLIGGGVAEMTMATFSEFLIKTAISTALSFALSYVIGALLPSPKKEAQDRRDNDIFSSIVNTVDSGIIIPLIYGMSRVGGQYISSNIETATDQRYPDPIIESTNNDNIYGDQGGDIGFSADFPGGIPDGPPNGDDSSAGPPSSSTSTTDYGGGGLTPDQY